ncbi:MAG: hypothetical protein K0S65_4064 [Labilithrix sp.]|nr:hypothetical protein [Labilithrix sp.]
MNADLAHRALAAATLYGLTPRTGRPRVACAPNLAGARDADLVVLVDTPPLDATAFASARDAAARSGVVAVVVASTAAVGLVHNAESADPPGTDAYARAAAWAARHPAHAPLAPPVSAARLRELVTEAASAGLVLVEADVPRVHLQARTAVERALVATIALGATARPLLFVHEARAPKHGHLRNVREERALDGWIARHAEARVTADPTSLLEAALAVLDEAATPVRGKDLLRAARSRWAAAAATRGERVTASSADAPALARGLVAAWLDGTLALYAADPAEPLER